MDEKKYYEDLAVLNGVAEKAIVGVAGTARPVYRGLAQTHAARQEIVRGLAPRLGGRATGEGPPCRRHRSGYAVVNPAQIDRQSPARHLLDLNALFSANCTSRTVAI